MKDGGLPPTYLTSVAQYFVSVAYDLANKGQDGCIWANIS